MKTYSVKAKDIRRDWYIIDATDLPLGRLASQVANRLKGKHKPEYAQHLDVGDYIVVVNAEKVKVTGNKFTDKMYYNHSEYPGGMTVTPFNKMLVKAPTRIIEVAVKGMLPKNPLGRAMFRKLKVYTGSEHQHQAQQPQLLNIEDKV